MDPVARKNLNLEVLKRHDANICDILDQSAHAVVYKFDTEKGSWEKLGYEGVIFLTQGKSAPYFGLYLLNRLSIENFCLHLTDFEEITLTDEFLIYLTSEGEACALWLFEKKDRERILAKILKLHEGMKSLPSAKQQQAPKSVESKVDILQMLKKATTTTVNTNTAATTTAKQSPLDTVGNDLIKVLRGTPTQQQLPPPQPIQQGDYRGPIPMPMPMHNNMNPGFTIPTSESSERAGNRLQELFDNANGGGGNPMNNMMPENSNGHVNSSSSSSSNRRAIANGELTKPFYPPFMNMSPTNSPRNPGALLQALHGGIPPPPPPPPPSVPMGIPLMPQQVLGLMRPEVNRRFGGVRPILSKPEFIQQLLNMIQCDPTFFDILYENYQAQMGPPPPVGPPVGPPGPPQQQQQ